MLLLLGFLEGCYSTL